MQFLVFRIPVIPRFRLMKTSLMSFQNGSWSIICLLFPTNGGTSYFLSWKRLAFQYHQNLIKYPGSILDRNLTWEQHNFFTEIRRLFCFASIIPIRTHISNQMFRLLGCSTLWSLPLPSFFSTACQKIPNWFLDPSRSYPVLMAQPEIYSQNS